MYLKRAETRRHLPIPRKGTKYVARAANHANTGIPVVVALRDVLKLTRTAKEVREVIKDRAIKINGKVVEDHKEGIRILNVFEADKKYRLEILATGRFTFEECNDSTRICKVDGKSVLKGGVVQLNLHDGSNVISKEKVKTGDSVELDFEGKVKKVIKFEKGSDVLVISGRHVGFKGKVESVDGSKFKISKEDGEIVLEKSHAIVR